MFASVGSILMLMMPAPGGPARPDNFNYRIPPSCGPEDEHSYSFRAFMTDISLWVMITDLIPHQQCAAIIMRLRGQARELARMITPQEIATGASGTWNYSSQNTPQQGQTWNGPFANGGY